MVLPLREGERDILGNMTKNCMETINSTFSGKTIKGSGEDEPIFVVLQGFPHLPHEASALYSFDQPQKDERLR